CVLVYSRCPAATDTYTLSLHDALPISHRHVSAGHALGAGDDVGLVAVALRTEVLTEPAEGADHLVRHQQHVVPVADLPHALEVRSEEHTSELQSRENLVCRLLLEKKKK